MKEQKNRGTRRAQPGKASVLLLAALVLVAGALVPAGSVFSGTTRARAFTLAETIRVGIYHGRDNVGTVSLQSNTGLSVSIAMPDGTRLSLHEQMDAAPVIVRKDAWFVRSPEGTAQEYTPSAGMPFAGVASGPIHLRIGELFPDAVTAAAAAAQYRQAGVPAYPAYEDGWQVWTGMYPDTETATAAKQSVADLLGTSAIAVLPATNARLVLLNASLDVLCLYGGTNGGLRVTALQEADLLLVNGRRYRGEMEFRRYADSDLTAINILGIEPYLYGVVPGEIEALAPTEAIKAQAVAARTYALNNIGRYAKWGFDLTDTTESQVYHGYEGEKVQTNLAVDATRGQKALYQGELASLFYFSSSGGRTEDNANVWGTPLPYLRSVEDPYEAKTSYNYYWQKVLSAADVERYLAAAGVNLGRVSGMSIVETSLSGRVVKLRITGTESSMTFQREACRTIFELPSQLYALGGSDSLSIMGADGSVTKQNPGGLTAVGASGTGTIATGVAAVAIGADGALSYTGTAASDMFVLTGRGWGHGVGMSQEGAKGFARNGYTYTQILQHYFPGVTIE